MKTKNLFYLIVSLCFVLSACESDDETNGSDGLPEGALPSSEFTPNNLPDEPYADDVIKIVAEDDDAPFYSLELMADGHYLLSLSRPASNLAKAVSEDKTADGACGICQSRQSSAMPTRIVIDEEGTRSSGYGGLDYGTFIKIADHKYRLNNGVEIDFSEYTVSTKTVKYKIPDGVVAVVNVYRVEPLQDVLTRSLCRAWNCNSFEVWGFINDAYVVHGKQTLVDGNVERQFQASQSSIFDIEEDDFLDDDDELCYKVVFSSNGTYICFYRDNTAEAYAWEWSDQKKGIIHTWDPAEYSLEKQDHQYFNVRFAGKQMRMYIDVSEQEAGMTARSVWVWTLTAAQ